MRTQVVIAPMCDPDNLYPTEGCVNLPVPAVTGVMSHFILSMLPEPQFFTWNSNRRQECLSSGQMYGH